MKTNTANFSNTERLWLEQPRQMPDPTTAKASQIVKDHPFVKPTGRLPIPTFLWPCWLVRSGRQNHRLYFLFAWCDEHRCWDCFGGSREWAKEIIIGGTIEARFPHHDHDEDKFVGGPSVFGSRFFAFYNFGAAPDRIQNIYKQYCRRGKGHCQVAPPDYLRRIEVIQDVEMPEFQEAA